MDVRWQSHLKFAQSAWQGSGDVQPASQKKELTASDSSLHDCLCCWGCWHLRCWLPSQQAAVTRDPSLTSTRFSLMYQQRTYGWQTGNSVVLGRSLATIGLESPDDKDCVRRTLQRYEVNGTYITAPEHAAKMHRVACASAYARMQAN